MRHFVRLHLLFCKQCEGEYFDFQILYQKRESQYIVFAQPFQNSSIHGGKDVSYLYLMLANDLFKQ